MNGFLLSITLQLSLFLSLSLTHTHTNTQLKASAHTHSQSFKIWTHALQKFINPVDKLVSTFQEFGKKTMKIGWT